MTSSKTCQIEILAMTTQIIYLRKYGAYARPTVELLPCACKAKHSLIMRANEIANHKKGKFRLCDFHFDHLYEMYKDSSTNIDDKIHRFTPFMKFRRNRL